MEEINTGSENQETNQEVKIDGKVTNSNDNDENVGMAIIAYIIFFIPLLNDSKDDPFVKFHVKQSLTIFCSYMILYFLRFFPIVGDIVWRLSPIVSLGWFILTIIGIVNAANKNTKELPLIGQYAERFFKF